MSTDAPPTKSPAGEDGASRPDSFDGGPEPRGRRRRLRAVVRFVASVAMVSGVLLLADAGVTLLWQEPVSAVMASRAQSGLENRLVETTRATTAVRRRLTKVPDVKRRLARLARAYRARAKTGDAIGRISMPTLDRSYVMVQGTDTASLRKGPGHYPYTPWPGQRGTVAVAGHRTTYLAPFRTIDRLRPGQPVILRMPYGRFTYRVQYTKIVKPTALWVTNPVGYDRLILSACHPLYSAAMRIVVFAKLTRAVPA